MVFINNSEKYGKYDDLHILILNDLGSINK
jgi:hypothetical protein